LTLTGINTYTGPINVLAGTLSAAADNNLGGTGASVTLNGGTLQLTGSGISVDNAISLGASNGTVDNANALILSGVISGSGRLTKTGAGTLTLSGTNTSSGGITVTAGTLTSPTSGLNNNAITDNAALVLDQSVDGSYSGVISGTGTLTKTGIGTVTLSGISTYSGATGITGGSLLVTGALANTASVTVANGATLGGSGSIGITGTSGAVTVQSGGILAPGNSPGLLTLNNGLTVSSGGILAMEITGTAAGTGYDQLKVNGSVDVTGATLSLSLGSFAPTAGDHFTLIDNDAADAISGQVAVGGTVLAQGDSVVVGSNTFLLSYTGGDGNDLVLTVNTPPTSSNASLSTLEDTAVVLTANDFGTYSDTDGTPLAKIRITSLPTAGTLEFNNGSWAGVTVNQDISSADLLAGKVRFTPAANGNGSPYASIGFKVSDGLESSSTDYTLSVTVTAVNDAPTVANTLTDQTATQDQVFSLTVPANTFADVDVGDTLGYSATLADGSALPVWLSFDAASASFSGTPTNADVGLINVKVTATDGSLATASSAFALTVANVNDAPTVAHALTNQTATQDQAFSLTVPANSFADVDVGDTLSDSATLADGSALPVWLVFDPVNRSFSGTPANADVGLINVKVTATDGSLATASSAFTLTVANVNDAPTVAHALTNQTATEDTAFSLTVPANTFADVDLGDTLSVTATLADGSALPAWLVFDPVNRRFTGTPANADVGLINVKVTATDGSLATASSAFVLSVANVNDAPTVAHALTDQTATEDQAFSLTVPANT
ncbi:MAG: putative Ig domain-containing protein, partial [Methylococcaceae bacterium]